MSTTPAFQTSFANRLVPSILTTELPSEYLSILARVLFPGSLSVLGQLAALEALLFPDPPAPTWVTPTFEIVPRSELPCTKWSLRNFSTRYWRTKLDGKDGCISPRMTPAEQSAWLDELATKMRLESDWREVKSLPIGPHQQHHVVALRLFHKVQSALDGCVDGGTYLSEDGKTLNDPAWVKKLQWTAPVVRWTPSTLQELGRAYQHKTYAFDYPAYFKCAETQARRADRIAAALAAPRAVRAPQAVKCRLSLAAFSLDDLAYIRHETEVRMVEKHHPHAPSEARSINAILKTLQ